MHISMSSVYHRLSPGVAQTSMVNGRVRGRWCSGRCQREALSSLAGLRHGRAIQETTSDGERRRVGRSWDTGAAQEPGRAAVDRAGVAIGRKTHPSWQPGHKNEREVDPCAQCSARRWKPWCPLLMTLRIAEGPRRPLRQRAQLSRGRRLLVRWCSWAPSSSPWCRCRSSMLHTIAALNRHRAARCTAHRAWVRCTCTCWYLPPATCPSPPPSPSFPTDVLLYSTRRTT